VETDAVRERLHRLAESIRELLAPITAAEVARAAADDLEAPTTDERAHFAARAAMPVDSPRSQGRSAKDGV
jgi:hypothetical protein